jgi:hypothetical protein
VLPRSARKEIAVSEHGLEERGRALEDEFFHKENERKLSALKQQLSAGETKEELAKASGMTDDAVLDKLVTLGLRGPTVAALSLVPLIAVAWADGELQDNERTSILHAANAKGMGPGTPGHEILSSWLSRKPDDSLVEAWEGYIKSLMAQLNDEQVRMLKSQIVGFAKVIAESAGGFLGFAKVSGKEEDVLARVGKAFDR